MPLYEYHCEKCSKTFEVMQKFSDAPLTSCPECGGSVNKLMSLTSFQLKGTGWYSSDYKKSPAAAAPPQTSSTDKKPGGGGGCGGGACGSGSAN